MLSHSTAASSEFFHAKVLYVYRETLIAIRPAVLDVTAIHGSCTRTLIIDTRAEPLNEQHVLVKLMQHVDEN